MRCGGGRGEEMSVDMQEAVRWAGLVHQCTDWGDQEVGRGQVCMSAG